jgi:mono/diheme cytochrome c family protein
MRHLVPLLLFLALACAKTEARKEPPAQPAAPAAPVANAARGKELMAQHGCNVCHVIPGVDGPRGALGPDLTGVAARPTISEGTVQNTRENLVRFIQQPASLNPNSAMPPLGIAPADAEDMAAYLLTLR